MYGYYVGCGYMGHIGNGDRLFATEKEYQEYYEENVYDTDYL